MSYQLPKTHAGQAGRPCFPDGTIKTISEITNTHALSLKENNYCKAIRKPQTFIDRFSQNKE